MNYFNLRDGSVGYYISNNGRCLKSEFYGTRSMVTVRNVIDDLNNAQMSTYLTAVGIYKASWIGLANYIVLEANGGAGSVYLFVDPASDDILAASPQPTSPYFYTYDINPTMLFGRKTYGKVNKKAFNIPSCRNVISLS
jgi:hypothetical protein